MGNNVDGGWSTMRWLVCACGRKCIAGVTQDVWKCPICRKGGDGTPKRCKEWRKKKT